MDAAVVDALAVLLADREGEPVAERDVARGVLVEERVVEDGVERADAPLTVDEGDLAEPRGAVVGLASAPERGAVLVRLDLDRTAALEPPAGRGRSCRHSGRAASSR